MRLVPWKCVTLIKWRERRDMIHRVILMRSTRIFSCVYIFIYLKQYSCTMKTLLPPCCLIVLGETIFMVLWSSITFLIFQYQHYWRLFPGSLYNSLSFVLDGNHPISLFHKHRQWSEANAKFDLENSIRGKKNAHILLRIASSAKFFQRIIKIIKIMLTIN